MAKNCGRHNALLCGCHYATGDYIVFVDDDQQCPVDKLWDLLAPINACDNDYDVSIARYSKKTQSRFKNFGSRVNDVVATWLLGKDSDLKFSNFSAMKRFVKDEILRYTNPFPYLSGLMLQATDRVINVDMEERERRFGAGGYTFKKSFSLWINCFTSFSVKPLRIAALLGLLLSFIGLILALVVVIRKILIPSIALGYSSIMAVLLFVGGMLMMMLGLIGEYVGRVFISINNAPQYVVRGIYGGREQGGEGAGGK